MCLLRCTRYITLSQHDLGQKRTGEATTHEKEHDGTWIVQFVHGVEVRDTVDIADVDDGKILDFLSDLVENLILSHTIRIEIATKANDDKALVFGENCLVDVPTGFKVRKDDGAHDDFVYCLTLLFAGVDECLCGGKERGDVGVKLSQPRAANIPYQYPMLATRIPRYQRLSSGP